MKKGKRLCGILLIITALIFMMLPVSEADAAASASDFKMEGSTLVKYRGTDTNVSVPDNVEIIGEGAFEENKNVELVVIPNSVKRIDAYAFWGCDNLDTVVLGRGMTEVGDYAFAGCKGLVQMTIPSNVTSIGNQAFGDCVNLKDITIPSQTANIAESAFDGCYQLTIHCEEGSAADTYSKDFYERQREMPEYEDVPDYRPEEPDESDTVSPDPEPTPTPQPVQTPEESGNVLGSSRVVGNRALVYISTSDIQVMGGNGEQSGEVLPAGSPFDEGIVNGLPKYTIVDGEIVADQAYYGNKSLGSVVLPEGIREIGQFSFARSSLTDISIPQGVTDICYGSFYHCDNLVNVVLPDTVMNVEPKAFEKTSWMDGFLESGEDFLITGGVLMAYGGNQAQVTVPEGVRVIAADAFAGHKEIESVTLPDSVRVIGEGAFENCSGLYRVNLGQGVEDIKDRAFLGCEKGASVQIPASVKRLGLRALEGLDVVYEGDYPENTYENSAARLSNEAYRGLTEEQTEGAGVSVQGSEGGAAYLEGAERNYVLTVALAGDTGAMEAACQRAFQSSMPENMTVYDLTLTDASGIPLNKLGKRLLTVVLPVPEALAGQKLQLLALDRNGQAEALPAERVSLNGVEAFRFRTDHLSLFGVYGTGAADPGEELQKADVEWNNLSAGPEETAVIRNPYLLRFLMSGIVFVTGVFLLLTSMEKKNRERKSREKTKMQTRRNISE